MPLASLFASLFVISHLGYCLVLSAAALLKKEFKKGKRTPVSIIIPAYNEGNVVERKIRNTLSVVSNKDEIMVAMDGHDEKTIRVCRKFKHVKLLNLQHKGKALALRTAAKKAKNKIILVTDADTILKKETVDKLSTAITEDVVASTGIQTISNGNYIQKSDYTGILGNHLYRYGASNLSSEPIVSGTFAIRKEWLEKIPDTITEDLDLGLMIMRAGKRVRFVLTKYDVTSSVAKTAKGVVRAKRRYSDIWFRLIRKYNDLWFTRYGIVALQWTTAPFIEKILILLSVVAALFTLNVTPILTIIGAIVLKDLIRVSVACKVFKLSLSKYLPYAVLRVPVTLISHLPTFIPISGGWKRVRK